MCLSVLSLYMKFPSNLNFDGKIVREMGPVLLMLSIMKHPHASRVVHVNQTGCVMFPYGVRYLRQQCFSQ